MWAWILKVLAGSFVQSEIKKIEGLLIERVKDEVVKHLSGKESTAPALITDGKRLLVQEAAAFLDKLLEDGQAKLGNGEPRAAAWFTEARAKVKVWAGL